MKFVSITTFCTAVMFIIFTFITSKTKAQLDVWAEYGWPIVFLKRFAGNDFYMSNQYFYGSKLLLDILFCIAISIFLVGTAWLAFNRKNKSTMAHN